MNQIFDSILQEALSPAQLRAIWAKNASRKTASYLAARSFVTSGGTVVDIKGKAADTSHFRWRDTIGRELSSPGSIFRQRVAKVARDARAKPKQVAIGHHYQNILKGKIQKVPAYHKLLKGKTQFATIDYQT